MECHSPSNVIKAWYSKVGFGIKHMPRFSMHWKCLSLGKHLVKISMVIFDVETCLSWIYLLSTLFFKWSGIEFPHVYFLNGIWDFHLRLLHFDYHNGLWLDLIVKKKVQVVAFANAMYFDLWRIMQLIISSCCLRKSFHQHKKQ